MIYINMCLDSQWERTKRYSRGRVRRDAATTSDPHANTNESLERCSAVDQEILIPFDDALLEKEDNGRAA